MKIYEAGIRINTMVCSIISFNFSSNTHFFVCFTFTCISAVGLISLIDTINNSITAEGVGPTAPFVTLKGVVTTVVVRWGNRIVLDAFPLIGLKFHAVRTATHSTVGGSRETEVAAEPVGVTALAGVFCQQSDEEVVSGFLGNYTWLTHSTTITLALQSMTILFQECNINISSRIVRCLEIPTPTLH